MGKLFIFLLLLTTYYLLPTAVASAASLYIYPQENEVYEGDTTIAELRLNTENEEVNTIEATIYFEGEGFDITDFSTGGSVFSFFITGPEIRADENSVFLRAAVPQGFNGEGVVGKISLRAGNAGEGSLRVDENSKVLLNDGKGTQASLEFTNGNFRIVEKPEGLVLVNSETHPMEDRWYNHPFIRIFWDANPNVQYSYILTRDPNEAPDDAPDEPVGDIKLTTGEEGIFYFNLKECADNVCGPVSSRKIMKDNSPPEPFEPILGQEDDVFGGKKFLSFATEDKVSGLDYWEVYEGDQRYVARSPYILQNQDYKGDIKVIAYDKAGNTREATVSAVGEKSGYNMAIIVGIMIIGTGTAVLFWVIRAKKRKKYTQLDSAGPWNEVK